jgi:hypothetical protein
MDLTGQRTTVHHQVSHEVIQIIRPDQEAAQQPLFNRDTYPNEGQAVGSKHRRDTTRRGGP